MSRTLYSDERRHLHQHLDELLDMRGVEGFELSLAVYQDEGVKVFAFGKGTILPEDRIRTDLRLLADKCRDMGTANALAMLPVIGTCIDYLERLYEKSHGEGAAPAHSASEVVQ